MRKRPGFLGLKNAGRFVKIDVSLQGWKGDKEGLRKEP
jgi:hypothetical protein